MYNMIIYVDDIIFAHYQRCCWLAELCWEWVLVWPVCVSQSIWQRQVLRISEDFLGHHFKQESSDESLDDELFQVMITFGQVTSALVDALFANVSDGWRYDFGLAAVPGVILLVGFIFCPESPRYLFTMNRFDFLYNILNQISSAKGKN